jgi:hypothetical protein
MKSRKLSNLTPGPSLGKEREGSFNREFIVFFKGIFCFRKPLYFSSKRGARQ